MILELYYSQYKRGIILNIVFLFVVYSVPEFDNEQVVNIVSNSAMSNSEESTTTNTNTHNNDEYELVNKFPILPPRPNIPR